MTTHLREKYVNPYTDFGFKKLFGTEMNKELLISFINSLLKGEEEIRDLTYLNTEHLGMREADRKAVFDVYCENERGEKILVEMQRGEQQFFKDRSLYYSTFPIREQGEKGEWNYELKTVYVIGILNFAIDEHKPDDYLRKVQLTDVQSKEVFYEKLTFIYLEMPKFNKREEELDGMFEKWLFVLRNLSRLMERPKALQERVFTRLFEAAEIAKFSVEEYESYEESLKIYRDWKNTIDFALIKGREKGFQKGFQKGSEQGWKKGHEKTRREAGHFQKFSLRGNRGELLCKSCLLVCGVVLMQNALFESDQIQFITSMPPVAVEQREVLVEQPSGSQLFAQLPGLPAVGYHSERGSCPVISKYFFMTSSEMKRSRRQSWN